MNPKVQFLRRTASERGEGKLKAVIVTAILIFLVYVGVKVVPPYVSEYQLSEKMQETARFASVTRSNEDKIRETIFREIQDLDIPATKEDVKVTAAGGRVSISVDYSVPIDLMVYKFDLHFTPSSSNKDII
ncbi:MAG TPA: DUF4845 domain-containing protein [Candidatus Sulfotelmatobacter sp.]|nr:DUF4845 domain-containing protein [Candidatus Sulfotelmatobacter sp.]